MANDDDLVYTDRYASTDQETCNGQDYVIYMFYIFYCTL